MAWAARHVVVISVTAICCFASFYHYAQLLSASRPIFHTSQHRPAHYPDDLEQQQQQSPGENYILRPEDHIYRQPMVVHLQWNITSKCRAPDGVEKRLYLINGQFPGPTIETRTGDTLVVEVQNHLNSDDEGISIHWHGITMRGTNAMDGVAGLTQCAIPPNRSMTYNFTINSDQAGTFWYHAHSNLQRADGLFGGLIVHRPVVQKNDPLSDQSLYEYDSEHLALIGDWYHRTADEVFNFYQNPGHYGLEPAPDSILINGKGQFNCSMAVRARPVNCSDVAKPSLHLGNRSRVRLRVINTGTLGGYALSLSQGIMRIITVDGGYPVAADSPATSEIGILYPGERMDLVLSSPTIDWTSQSSEEEAAGQLTVHLDTSNMPTDNYALNPKQSFPITWQRPLRFHARQWEARADKVVSSLRFEEIHGKELANYHRIHSDPIEKAVLYSALAIRSDNFNKPVGSINHTSWAPPMGNKTLLALPREEWEHAAKQPATQQELVVPVFNVSGAEHWIEVVLNNFDESGHPFHIHGYEVFVVAKGVSESFRGYNPFDKVAMSAAKPPNTRTPLRKDTIYIPSMGYAVMRFPLDNNGLWLLHCHILWHQAAGMGLFFQVGSEVSPRARSQAAEICASL